MLVHPELFPDVDGQCLQGVGGDLPGHGVSESGGETAGAEHLGQLFFFRIGAEQHFQSLLAARSRTSSLYDDTATCWPVAADNAPAASPATPANTMTCELMPPPPTPAISEVLVTRPAMAPSKGRRRQPPVMSCCWSGLAGVRVSAAAIASSKGRCVPASGSRMPAGPGVVAMAVGPFALGPVRLWCR